MAMYLNACSKCGGALYEETDVQGPYLVCIQCGRELTRSEREQLVLAVLAATRQETTPTPEEQVAV